MKLSSATGRALRALVYLARHGGRRPAPAHALARAAGLPGKSVPPMLRRLKWRGVLHALRGSRGGYCLARPPEDITLLEAVEAVEGPVRGEAPPLATTAEGRRFDARLQQECERATEVERGQLRRLSLADLAGA